MKKQIKIILFLSIVLLVFSSCCKKKLQEPPVVVNCGEGFQRQDDTCFCPDGNFVLMGKDGIHTVCKSLAPNEYYVKLPDDCNCYAGDTVVVAIEWDQNKIFLVSSKSKMSSQFATVGIDSFYTYKITSYGIIDLFRTPCIINNLTCGGQFAGHKPTGGDSLNLKLYFRSLEDWFNLPLDSCDLTLTK